MSVRFLFVPIIVALFVCGSAANGEFVGIISFPGQIACSADPTLPVVSGTGMGPWGGSSPFTHRTDVFFVAPLPCTADVSHPDSIILPQVPATAQPALHGSYIWYPTHISPEKPGSSVEQPAEHRVNGAGTIRWTDLEGGFFGIESDEGILYLPLNLGEEYRVDGMRVAFSGLLAPGTATIQMWGTPLTLLSISGTDGAPDWILVKYRRSGGIAGFNDELIVYGNGTAVITRRGQSASRSLSGSDLDALIKAGEEAGFPYLSGEYPPEEGACDLFFYVVTWKGITVHAADTVVPASMAPLLDQLNRIVSCIPPW